jgi:hypothetical protein
MAYSWMITHAFGYSKLAAPTGLKHTVNEMKSSQLCHGLMPVAWALIDF